MMTLSISKLGVATTLLASLTAVNAQNDSTLYSGPVWNHEDYTTSPPVYPSPNITGKSWETALEKAKAWVAQLTLEEKSQLVTGTEGPCVGNIAPIERLNFTGLCLQDGPLAIRQATYASVFPAGLTVAAAWDRDLAYIRGYQIGEEYKAKGSHIALGPVAGPLGRSGLGGRNWEGFSPDPYLTGLLMGDTIRGHQGAGVQACAKHYIGNEQETQRNPSDSPVNSVTGIAALGSASAATETIEALSSNIDDRTLHELYLWPFYDAIQAGVASVMCSYQRVNGSYGCQNSKLLNGILKEELGFQGYVVSDWMATHAGYHAADAGLDMNMPGGLEFSQSVPSLWGANLTTSVNNGSLDLSRMDNMAHRIMAPYFYLGQDKDFPAIDADTPSTQKTWAEDTYRFNFTYGEEHVDVRSDHHKLIREIGSAGTVLLKNTNGALPLTESLKNVAVFGNDAGDLTNGLYFATLTTPVGFEIGVLPAAGGSGTGRFTYVVDPLSAIKQKIGNDRLVQYVLNNTQIAAGNGWDTINPQPEVCLVFLNTWASEAFDRTSLLLDNNGTDVVEKVAANCANTIVFTHSAGLNVLPFADHPNVTAILAGHLSGQEVGNSVVDILWGAVNPSGKLPYTIAKNEEDYDFVSIVNSTELIETTDPNAWQDDFRERLLIDYLGHFDYFNQSVQYEFGFGLSYTTFSIDQNISVNKASTGSISALPAESDEIVPGGNPALWEYLYEITATVTNTGSLEGATVPQLYLSFPQLPNEATEPVQVLRGFQKVNLQPGESATVTFPLARRDLSYWDTVSQQWTIYSGSVGVAVGLSSRDIQATTTFTPIGAAAPGSYRHRRF
ncbi:putative beta-glucosidase G [Fulvia fulva]|uniref:Probable beta-glucosidase G n=1 Tax=Passalora fulva TaxID=5499 RepID=A0A9Q8P9E8_PASFU|nr:putative beta-glucosidase G [Fulvia fulva]KAK4625612.1 putative beta-glucosidase G [Fulvia fulva]UJO17987.1 putative beta-glucosidase G [Fulvia fulva]